MNPLVRTSTLSHPVLLYSVKMEYNNVCFRTSNMHFVNFYNFSFTVCEHSWFPSPKRLKSNDTVSDANLM